MGDSLIQRIQYLIHQTIQTGWKAYDKRALIGLVMLVAGVVVQYDANKDVLPPWLHEYTQALLPYAQLVILTAGVLAAQGQPLLVSKPKPEQDGEF